MGFFFLKQSLTRRFNSRDKKILIQFTVRMIGACYLKGKIKMSLEESRLREDYTGGQELMCTSTLVIKGEINYCIQEKINTVFFESSTARVSISPRC